MNTFIRDLQNQAKKQSQLSENKFLPSFLIPFLAFVGNHPWQSLLIASFVIALIMYPLTLGFF